MSEAVFLALITAVAAPLVGAAVGGSTLSAIVFTVARLSPVGFRYRIKPWPWQVAADLIRSRRR